MGDFFFHMTRSPRVIQRSLKMLLETQAPSIFLLCRPQKIRSLMVTRWLLNLQALCLCSRQEERKEAKQKKYMPVGSVLFFFIRKWITFP